MVSDSVLDMGAHSVPRGEESTYAGNGGKQNPIHVGKHRAPDTKPTIRKDIEGHSMGSRTEANPKYTQESE